MSHPSKEELHDRVEHNHGYHRPNYQDTMDKMGAIRQETASVAHKLIELCPISDELLTALNHLDKACMQAIAALARNEPEGLRPNVTSHPTGGAAAQPAPPLLPGDPGYVQEQSNIGKTFDEGQRS